MTPQRKYRHTGRHLICAAIALVILLSLSAIIQLLAFLPVIASLALAYVIGRIQQTRIDAKHYAAGHRITRDVPVNAIKIAPYTEPPEAAEPPAPPSPRPYTREDLINDPLSGAHGIGGDYHADD